MGIPVVKALFDTNILIDFLNGVSGAKREIERYDQPAISLISWMETLAGVKDSEEGKMVRGFLRHFDVRPITEPIAEQAVRVRRDEGLRLPDAIIYATASEMGCLLVTRNTRDFSTRDPMVRVPYRV